MMNALGALANDEVTSEQLQKQLLRHQVPMAVQVESLVQLIEYQKSFIPQHLVNPLIDSVIKHVCSSLDKLKIDYESVKQQKTDILKKVQDIESK